MDGLGSEGITECRDNIGLSFRKEAEISLEKDRYDITMVKGPRDDLVLSK